jgi:membrane-bound ClpP family serine protease
MRAVGLVLALLGALGLAVEVFDAGLPVRVPLVVSGIVLVFGLLLLTAGGHDDDP